MTFAPILQSIRYVRTCMHTAIPIIQSKTTLACFIRVYLSNLYPNLATAARHAPPRPSQPSPFFFHPCMPSSHSLLSKRKKKETKTKEARSLLHGRPRKQEKKGKKKEAKKKPTPTPSLCKPNSGKPRVNV
ncbi:hypothetical protein BS50DRAFT_348148 [Corynespora cassiicola Philippines]|uniref:Uncharacterized protein n=1 Tax=Corynespora cassiicola Philippines TaxID=1448308 RepID=A0A2T2NQT3_CORCC|nr:hypothetical protein BS50DRAFT_348148 [Corynespora cassiicola Philippines]